MNTILAVDTSCDACSIALLNHGQVSAEFVHAPREHSQRLLPMIDAMLQGQGVALADVDAIAYGRGPGSFTGLRICLGIVQGLAYSVDLPVIPVSTLHAMAVGAAVEHQAIDGSYVLAALDARMNEVYWALYQVQQGQVIAVTDEYVSAPEDVAQVAELKSVAAHNLIKVGPGCHYPALTQIQALSEDRALLPRAECMLTLAQAAWEQGKTETAEHTQPVYLRDSVAWKKRQRIRI